MNGCEQICYQHWIDMYNAKDKECFDLQLKLSKVKEIADVIVNTNCNHIKEAERILEIIRNNEK